MLLVGRLQQQRDGRGLDREASLLLVDAAVGVPLAVARRLAAALGALLCAHLVKAVRDAHEIVD